ncbi:hypothetical protein [Paracoccus beibuensis]|uniref:hypothetical protein n=1 Tax=Paracoccus beibuensis TaxID=547602 RepID=UPI002240D7B3|nr:hypothetical protein [Paracoccus beibuensis]
MNPWLIAGLCCAGSSFIAWGAARLRLRWPLLVLSALLAAIAIQLFLAARGQEGFRDLAALVAQAFTVLPALVGVACGTAMAGPQGHRLAWCGRTGLATVAALLLSAAVVGATFLI